MKKSLTACVLTLLILIGVTFNSVAQTKCLANDYPLNGNANDIVAAKNGTLYNTTSTTDRFGRSNFALQFNGSSSWVKLGTDADLKERTISLWVKVDTFLAGGNYSFGFTTDNANTKYGGTGVTIDNSGGTNRISFGVGANIIRYTNAVKNKWYHCAIVVNAKHYKVFINGKIVDSTLNNSLSHSIDGDPYAHLGASRKSDRFFKGSIDDVKIYSCGLANSAIDSLYKFVPCSASFSDQPASISVALNDSAKFIATSLDTLATYQWQISTGTSFTNISNGGQFSGAKTNKLAISKVKYSSNNGNKIRCVAVGKTCADTSAAAILTVTCPTLLKNNPSNQNGNNGSSVKFNVSALYSGTTFQWQKDDGSGFKDIANSSQFSGSDKDTLTMSDLLYSNNTNKFRCIASFEGCNATSSNAILIVNCKPLIKVQPDNVTVSNGNKAVIGMVNYDAGTTYQWKTKIGSSFQNLFDAGQYAGTSDDSLIINPVDMSNKSQQFKCFLNYKGCKDSTKIATLDVLCNPIVASNPQNQTKTEGETALFTLSSLDNQASYEWQVNGGIGYQNLNNSTKIKGVTNDSLIISNLALADNNQKFRCILSSAGCKDTSEPATLIVSCKTLIGTQPKNTNGVINGSTILHVKCLEPNANFAWQSDVGFGFQNLSNAGQYDGVNTDTLTISSLANSNNNQKFRCIITFGNCVETTDVASISVKSTGITQSEQSEISIFPNPSNGFIQLKINPELFNNSFNLIDQQGRIIIAGKLTETNTKISIEQLASGVYILQTEPTLTRTLIIKN